MSELLRLIVFFTFLIFFNDITHTVASHPGNGKPFGSSGPFLYLDETTDLSTRAFFDNYVRNKKPIVLRNGSSMFPSFKLWNDKYLHSEAEGFDEFKMVVETSKKESRAQKILQLSMREFLKDYKSKEMYLVNEVPDYLRKDVPLPQPLQCEQAPDTIDQSVKASFFFKKHL